MNKNSSIRALQLIGFRSEHWHLDYCPQYEKLNARLEKVAVSAKTARPNSILLAGSLGAGKSGMLACFCKSIFENWAKAQTRTPAKMLPDIFAHSVKYCTHDEFLESWKSTMGDKHLDLPTPEYYKEAKILFLDDLGAAPESVTGYNISKIEDLIDWRWSQGLKTFVATNLSPDETFVKDVQRSHPRSPQWHRIFRRLLEKKWMLSVVLTHSFILDELQQQIKKRKVKK